MTEEKFIATLKEQLPEDVVIEEFKTETVDKLYFICKDSNTSGVIVIFEERLPQYARQLLQTIDEVKGGRKKYEVTTYIVEPQVPGNTENIIRSILRTFNN